MQWNRETLLRQFSLAIPGPYHDESRQRVAHLAHDTLRKAAVLIGLVERHNELFVVMTQRAQHLRHHPGQVSFPGGKQEHHDTSLFDTAVRETQEEIGITADNIEVFGQLPPLVTVSGFSVTPIMAFIQPDYRLSIDANEVAAVFEVPLSYLLDKRNLITQRFMIKSQPHRIFAFPYQQYLIWGATAQMLHLLQQHLAYSQ